MSVSVFDSQSARGGSRPARDVSLACVCVKCTCAACHGLFCSEYGSSADRDGETGLGSSVGDFSSDLLPGAGLFCMILSNPGLLFADLMLVVFLTQLC